MNLTKGKVKEDKKKDRFRQFPLQKKTDQTEQVQFLACVISHLKLVTIK